MRGGTDASTPTSSPAAESASSASFAAYRSGQIAAFKRVTRRSSCASKHSTSSGAAVWPPHVTSRSCVMHWLSLWRFRSTLARTYGERSTSSFGWSGGDGLRPTGDTRPISSGWTARCRRRPPTLRRSRRLSARPLSCSRRKCSRRRRGASCTIRSRARSTHRSTHRRSAPRCGRAAHASMKNPSHNAAVATATGAAAPHLALA